MPRSAARTRSPIHGMDLTYILGQMSRAKSRVNVVILDACRDNPFAKRAPATLAGPGADGCADRHACWPTPPRRASRRPTASASAATASTRAQLAQAPADARAAGGADVQAGARGRGARVAPAAGAVGAFVAARRVRVRARPQCQQRGGRSRRQRRDRVLGQHSDAARGPTTSGPTCGSTRRAASPTSARARIAELSAPVAASAGSRTPLMPRVGDTWRYRVTGPVPLRRPVRHRARRCRRRPTASPRPGPPPPMPRCAPRWCR